MAEFFAAEHRRIEVSAELRFGSPKPWSYTTVVGARGARTVGAADR